MSVSFEVPKEVYVSFCEVLAKYDKEQADDALEAFTKWHSTHTFTPNNNWSIPLLDELIHLCKGQHGIGTQLRAYRKIKNSSDGDVHIRDLKMLPHAIATYLAKDAIDGWVYLRSQEDERDVYVAYVVDDLEYIVPYNRDSSPYVRMSCRANVASWQRHQEVDERKFVFGRHDLAKHSISELLYEEGIYKETEET